MHIKKTFVFLLNTESFCTRNNHDSGCRTDGYLVLLLKEILTELLNKDSGNISLKYIFSIYPYNLPLFVHNF